MGLSGTFDTFHKMKATGKIGAWFADGRARSKTDDSPRRETWEQSQQHQDEYARLHVTTTGSLDRINVDRRRCDLRFEIVDREPVPDREEELRKRKGSFFADMEANMLRRMERDNINKEQPLPHQAVSPEERGSEEKAAEETSYGANRKSGGIDKKKEDDGSRRRRPRPRRVISGRGNSLVIAKLVKGGNERQKERRRIVGFAPLPATAEGVCEDSLRDSVESVKSEAHQTSPRQLPNRRRNSTCGTIDVRSTTVSSAPDDEEEAMIRCVCSIIWAHALQSARSKDASSVESLPSARSDDYEVFNDRPSSSAGSSPSSAVVPSLDEIVNFYRDIFRRCQLESDCVVISLIYLERLVKETGGSLRPSSTNWRSLLLSCLVLASKVWDDLSMDSGDFSRACRDALLPPGGASFYFTPERITSLELAAFGCLGFEAGVSASEYARYYFLLRSAMVRSGLSAKEKGGGEADGRSSSTIASSLNVEGTRRLKRMMSSNFTPCVTRRRSVGEVEEMIGRSSSYRRIKQEQLVRL